MNKKLAELLFPNNTRSVEHWLEKYPKRNEGVVTRFAPSPTGFMHLGNLFSALISERLAHTTGGTFYLRIEDTDKRREVEGGAEFLIKALEDFDINFDEGYTFGGDFAPYKQSERVNIYHSFAKELVIRGLAYPCFCSAEELEDMRKNQEVQKTPIYGYFGEWAKCRELSFTDIEYNIVSGKSWVLRFRSDKIQSPNEWKDGIKGKIKITPNEQDIVLLKADGVPTYHFAHAVDDHLMGTTHVVRGEEWLSSLPIHLQLFQALKLKPPNYLHIPSIMKIDPVTGNKRKLSKRKDPEASLQFYEENGYPHGAVIEYLLSIINSNFEIWRKKNPEITYKDFPFEVKNIGNSAALFDIVKLDDVSKEYISRLTPQTVLEKVLQWAAEFNREYFEKLNQNREFAEKVFEIAYKQARPRKDFATWKQTENVYRFFYERPQNQINEITHKYAEIYDHNDPKDLWYEKVKKLAETFNYASDNKIYKENPANFVGNIGDFMTIIRLALTGNANSPDLYDIMQILGEKETLIRFKGE